MTDQPENKFLTVLRKPYMKKKGPNKQNKLIPSESSFLLYTTPDGSEKEEATCKESLQVQHEGQREAESLADDAALKSIEQNIAQKKPARVVCLDEGFAGNDRLKANAVQIFKTRGVTSFKTV